MGQCDEQSTDLIVNAVVSVEKFERTNSTNDDCIFDQIKILNLVRTLHRHNHQPKKNRKKITNLLTDIYSIPAHSQE